MLKNRLTQQYHLFTGIIIGILITLLLDYTQITRDKCHITNLTSPIITGGKPTPLDNNNRSGVVVRPRYYSTELGIRSKLFIGISTDGVHLKNRVLPLNSTIPQMRRLTSAHVKFFMTAKPNIVNDHHSGVIGFTDSRLKYRIFHILQYIGVNFGQYDFYYLGPDSGHVNWWGLERLVDHLSVSTDVYLGMAPPNTQHCSFDGGIVISNSVLTAVNSDITWCRNNAISTDFGVNLGNCIHHTMALSCQTGIFHTYHLTDPMTMTTVPSDVITVYPVLEANNFHLLNMHFLTMELKRTERLIDRLTADIDSSDWPIGGKKPTHPTTRFDVPSNYYFNMTHVMAPDDFTVTAKHHPRHLDAINMLIRQIVANQSHLTYVDLVNGYRRFDLSRGLDYVFDLRFKVAPSGDLVTKRFHAARTLGKIELLPMPYITEHTRITIIVTITEDLITDGVEFLNYFTGTFLDTKSTKRMERVFLMIVLLYAAPSINHGPLDRFNAIKSEITRLNTKLRYSSSSSSTGGGGGGNFMGWLSIRLPPSSSGIEKVLPWAIIDLTVRKLTGVDTLILTLDVYCQLTSEFLNRVRMNTIRQRQIYSVIPFRQYNTAVTNDSTLRLTKYTGHFDSDEYGYVSFYANDYLTVRNHYEAVVPRIRNDNDLGAVNVTVRQMVDSVFDMFVTYGALAHIHCLRATEPDLKIRYYRLHQRDYRTDNLFLGTKTQLAKFVLTAAN